MVPVLFLVFNRPVVTAQVMESIRQARPPKLYVAADGPRPGREGEAELCAQTRAIATAVDWPCEVITLFREQNLGCRLAVSGAITWFFSQVEAGIVLEDDCLCDPSFFVYANECLERYKYDERVMHISASNFQFGAKRGDASYFFSHYNHIWGWASWQRAMKHFDVELKELSREQHRQNLKRLFDRSQDRGYWLAIYDYLKSGNINTWDYHWQFMLWHHNGMGIIPQVNMVQNLGFGMDATNGVDPNYALADLPSHPLAMPLVHPSTMEVDREADIHTADDFFGISRSARTFHMKVKIATRMTPGQKNRIKKMIVKIKAALKG